MFYFFLAILNITNLHTINVNLHFIIKKRWKVYGMHLGVNATLEAIECLYSSDSMRCLTEVLAKWLKGEGSPTTWKVAVRAIISLSKHNENIRHLPSALMGNIYIIILISINFMKHIVLQCIL